MIRTLQKKFVITAMAAITVLLLVLLGAINVVNAWSVNQQTERLLAMLSDSEQAPAPKKPHEEERQDFLSPPITEDTAMSAVYFLVRLDADGEVAYTDVSRIASVTEEEAGEYADTVNESGKLSGTVGHFKYRITVSPDNKQRAIVFLDTTSQLYTILRVLALSVFMGLLCWILMLLLVIILSKRAILPIALSVEKQKQFVTDAGHEIKTPLSIILANTDALELHSGESKWSRNIREQTMRLNGLMQNLLTLAKMEEGQKELLFADFPADRLLEETLEPFYELARKNEIEIQTDIQPDTELHANRDNIMRLFSILMDNAVKYTNPKGKIMISLKKQEKEVLFQIKNTCDKIPEAEAERMFDRFYRGDAARTQRNGGYGIGLSAAQAIVEAHKGSIKAEYENGNTVVFTVKL